MKDKFGFETLESMNQAVWYNQWVVSKFKKYLKGKILEVGCGIGNFTESILPFGQVYALDINDEYVTQTKKAVGDKALVGIGDIEKGEYFFKDVKFNSIICLNVLEHIKDDKRALSNLYNLLENEGTLVLLVPAHQFMYGKIDEAIGHHRRYDKLGLADMAKKTGFKIVDIKGLNMLGAVGWIIASKLFKDTTVSDKKIKMFNLIAPFVLPLESLISIPFGTSLLLIAKK